jgi:hypothetical protein
MKPDERDAVVERMMGSFEPPPPPAELRSKTLAAARERMSVEPAPDIWSRVWNHGGLRLAWAASVVLLLAGHVLVGTGSGPKVAPDLVTENRVDDDIVEMLRPVQISDSARPIIGLFASAGDPTEIDVKGNAS